MRQCLVTVFLCLLPACRPAAERPANPPVPPLAVTREQFRSLSWLEGRWRGTLNDTMPFYEGYQFINDSTLRSVNYTDSTGRVLSDSDQITLRGTTVTSGDITTSGYVVTALDSTSVHFEPRGRANNNFTWARQPDGSWIATLNWKNAAGEPMERVYVMRPLKG